MTRKEEIARAVKDYHIKQHPNFTYREYVAFIDGAEWADSHTNWISVEDELPKEDGTYLFYDAGTQGVYVSYFWADLELNEKVTHWMRIKKPTENREGEQQ